MPDIEFICPKCGGGLIVSERGAGCSVPCPECGQTVVIPHNPDQKPSSSTNTKSSNDIHFVCSFCTHPLSAPAAMESEVFECPKCNQLVIVPLLTESQTQTSVAPQTFFTPLVKSQTYWHYTFKGKRLGPISDAEIRQLLETGALDNKTLVWKTNFDNWMPIGQTALKKSLATMPPLTAGVVFAWIIAFIPVWGTILTYIVAEATESHAQDLWFIFIILNVLFCSIDSRVLKNAGHNTEKFGTWAVWLVPCYLYRRAKALNQSLSYFIVWMMLFGASFFLPAVPAFSETSLISTIRRSSSMNISDLTSQVESSIRDTWSKDDNHASAYVKKLTLIHRSGNQYVGLLVASIGNKDVQFEVDVTYDGRSLIWKINRR